MNSLFLASCYLNICQCSHSETVVCLCKYSETDSFALKKRRLVKYIRKQVVLVFIYNL